MRWVVQRCLSKQLMVWRLRQECRLYYMNYCIHCRSSHIYLLVTKSSSSPVACFSQHCQFLQFQVENNPYDPSLMVFMDYREYMKQKVPYVETEYPTFLYAMPMSPTRVFFEVYSMYFSSVIISLIRIMCKILQKVNCRKLVWLQKMQCPSVY